MNKNMESKYVFVSLLGDEIIKQFGLLNVKKGDVLELFVLDKVTGNSEDNNMELKVGLRKKII